MKLWAQAGKAFVIGVALSIISGLIFFFALHEPGSLYYPFATVAFVGGPLLAVCIAWRSITAGRLKGSVVAGVATFIAVLALFIFMYAGIPGTERTSIHLPATCNGLAGAPHPPPALAYRIPGIKNPAVLVMHDQGIDIAAIISPQAPHPSDVYVLDANAHRVISEVSFPNDVIDAGVEGGIVHIYNDKLGYLFDAHTGAAVRSLLLIDNYGGLSTTDRPAFPQPMTGNSWWIETSAIISSWRNDGSVHSRPFIWLNSIARGCWINGRTGSVTKI